MLKAAPLKTSSPLLLLAVVALLAAFIFSFRGATLALRFRAEYQRADQLQFGPHGQTLLGMMFAQGYSYQVWQIKTAAYPIGQRGFILLLIGAILASPTALVARGL